MPSAGPTAPASAALSAELEAALLRALAALFDHENWLRFSGRLKPPVLALADGVTRLGCWRRDTRTLELSRALIVDAPWPDVVAVFQHELAHQYVDEVLGVRDETAHGDSFRRVCAERGIDGRAAGVVGVPAGARPEIDRVLERVRKLLSLAGSANQHEAEIAMRRAHELMLRHNVEAATGPREFEVRQVGDPMRRVSATESAVLVLLADCFFVKVIRVPVYLAREGRGGTVTELSGTRANLELALHVHGFLLDTAERLWRARRGDARVRDGRDRVAFQTGVIRGFHDKLRAERTALTGTGLVWQGDAGLDAFYRRRHPRVTRRRRSVRPSQAHQAGREAGHQVILHRPVSAGPGASTRLLRGR